MHIAVTLMVLQKRLSEAVNRSWSSIQDLVFFFSYIYVSHLILSNSVNLRFFGWDVSAEGGEEAAAERCHSSTSRPSGAKQSGHLLWSFPTVCTCTSFFSNFYILNWLPSSKSWRQTFIYKKRKEIMRPQNRKIFREHPQIAILETCGLWKIRLEWWELIWSINETENN